MQYPARTWRDLLDDVSSDPRRFLHREHDSVQQIEEIIRLHHMTLPELPHVWEIDETLLPAKVRNKLAGRAAAGLANPIHADRASEIIAGHAPEYANPGGARTKKTPFCGRMALSRQQKESLHDELIFTGPVESIETSRGRAGGMLSCLQTRHNRNDGTIQIIPLAAVVLSFALCLAVNASIALCAFFVIVSLIGLANYQGSKSLDLTADDYLAMESATIAREIPDKNSQECRLIQLTYGLRQEIERMDIWSSDFLRNQVRPNLKNEVDQVARHAVHIIEIRRNIIFTHLDNARSLTRLQKVLEGRSKNVLPHYFDTLQNYQQWTENSENSRK
ncbi:hypothetical protein R3Q06_34295 [Rhodococcus erythropolis]|uniref:hypothetical protein n=1 Tax=Rhodococcus erythropolis TaxID=1833 RepID=UPI00294938A5|nr:hypothetical protein [Rhodococcus erythropolis]MDV6278481.1 hypothetical protein [Rhodococcus erythropolis]